MKIKGLKAISSYFLSTLPNIRHNHPRTDLPAQYKKHSPTLLFIE